MVGAQASSVIEVQSIIRQRRSVYQRRKSNNKMKAK